MLSQTSDTPTTSYSMLANTGFNLHRPTLMSVTSLSPAPLGSGTSSSARRIMMGGSGYSRSAEEEDH